MKRKLYFLLTAALCMLFMSACSAIDTEQLLNNLSEQLADSMGVTMTPTPIPEPTASPTPTPIPKPSESRREAEAAEVFTDEYAKEAAAIIDDAIWQALDAMTVADYRGFTSDVIYSDVSVPYSRVCERYDRMQDSDYRDFFEMAYEAGTNFMYFYVRQAEYGKSLISDSINAVNVLLLYDFRLQCYFDIMSDGWNQYSGYFDPDMDANYEVEYDSPEFEAVKRKMSVYDAVISRVVDKMPDGLSTFQKYQYLSYVISYQCHYTEADEGRRNKHTSYGALINGSAVCEGYTKALIELCREADLACEYVCGTATSAGEGHMWNLITLEDGTHHTDVTWCDGNAEPDNYYWFDYFCRAESELDEIDHTTTEGNIATGEDIYKW